MRQAEDWHANLVVVGSHGASLVGRLMVGSVPHQLLTSAPCSVRIGRRSDSVVGEPLRLVLGVDGSSSAGAAAHCVAQRSWPPGTATRVVVAVERPLALIMPGAHGLDAGRFGDNEPDSKACGYHAAQAAVDELHRAGLSAVPVLREGSPKRVLIEEADEWDADCIFIGADGLRRSDRLRSAPSQRPSLSGRVVQLKSCGRPSLEPLSYWGNLETCRAPLGISRRTWIRPIRCRRISTVQHDQVGFLVW